MRRLLSILLVATAISGFAQGTYQGISGYSANNPPVSLQFDGSLGWTFRCSDNCTVTSLGAFTEALLGQDSVRVGLWDNAGNLIASSLVTSRSRLKGNSRFEPINPVLIGPGQVYRLGAYATGNLIASDVAITAQGDVIIAGPGIIPVAGAAFDAAFEAPVALPGYEGVIFLAPNFEFTAQPTGTTLPNLTTFQPPGWSDKVVVDSTPSTNAPSPSLTENQEVFVSWAAQNSPAGGSVSNRFYTQLYLDGAPKTAWSTDSLSPGSFTFIIGYNLGKLSPGTHVVRIEADSTGAIGESDETDNSCSRTFVVNSSASTPPQVTSPSFSTNGSFQFTITGISNRTYQVNASTNLVSWDLIATILNTNAEGVILFIDPASTNLPRRYYRPSLVVP
jgi:hypothetical protein